MNKWTKPRMEHDDASPSTVLLLVLASIVGGVALVLIINYVKEK